MAKVTFGEWIALVDRVLYGRVGMSHEDLPDIDYSGMWEKGVKPEAAAAKAIKNAKEN